MRWLLTEKDKLSPSYQTSQFNTRFLKKFELAENTFERLFNFAKNAKAIIHPLIEMNYVSCLAHQFDSESANKRVLEFYRINEERINQRFPLWSTYCLFDSLQYDQLEIASKGN